MFRSEFVNYPHSTTNDQERNTHISDTVKNLNKDRFDQLRLMILKANTTSVLNTLEEHRKNLSVMAFRSLILLLTEKFNNPTSIMHVQQKNSRTMSRITKNDIDRCLLIILYYIVSVINKYKITAVDPIWTEILKNPKTQTITFYRFLYNNNIMIPAAICTHFSKELSLFYSSQSSEDTIKLILLGFSMPMKINPHMRIKDYEKFFSEVNQQELLGKNLKPEQIISSLNTPEKLALFLSYFSDYDLNTIDPNTNYNVLEKIINMKPYFYKPRKNNQVAGHRFRRFRPKSDISKPGPHPNDIAKYRTARILNLLKSVILQGAQLSKPCYDDIAVEMRIENRFFTTSIGIYALIGLRMDDIYPSESPWERDRIFVSNIINLVRNFHPEFKEFILHRLATSYSIIHKELFINQQRAEENIQIENINDKLFQRCLTLKEWCRLKIKDVCPQKDIIKLELSKSLIDYCSYGLLASNYAFKCIDQVTRYKGHLMRRHRVAMNALPATDSSDDEY